MPAAGTSRKEDDDPAVSISTTTTLGATTAAAVSLSSLGRSSSGTTAAAADGPGGGDVAVARETSENCGGATTNNKSPTAASRNKQKKVENSATTNNKKTNKNRKNNNDIKSSSSLLLKPIGACPLLCCFYAEFHIELGPRIAYQCPDHFMEQDIRLPISEMEKLLLQETTFNVHENDDGHQENEQEEEEAVGSASEAAATTSVSAAAREKSKPPSGDDDTITTATTTTTTTTTTKTESQTTATSTTAAAAVVVENDKNNSINDDSLLQQFSIFNSCSEYIITGPELTGKILNLSTHQLHVLTRPTILSNNKYARNSLLFCVGFVLRRSEDPRPFRPVLSRLATILSDMEVQSGFLSHPSHRSKIPQVLRNIVLALNSERCECNLQLGPADLLNLKLFRPPKLPPVPVKDHAVPILLRRDWQVQTYDWDLAINWVSLHIDGLTSARQISQKAEVDMEMVRACLRVLKHHGVIALVDMFFYSNRYECTEKAASLLFSKENRNRILEEAAEFIIRRKAAPVASTNSGTGNGSDSSPELTAAGTPPLMGRASSMVDYHSRQLSPSPVPAELLKEGHALVGSYKLQMAASHYSNNEIHFASVMKSEEYEGCKRAIAEFLCSCGRSKSVGELWIDLVSGNMSTATQLNWKKAFRMLDHRRLTTFGLVNGIIRRVHNYAILLDSSSSLPDREGDVSAPYDRIRPFSQRSAKAHQEEERQKLAIKAAVMLDGKHCDDELVCALERPFDEIMSWFPRKKIVSVYATSNTSP